MIDERLIKKGADAYRHGHPDDGSDADDAVNRDVARILTAVLPEHRAQVIRECAEAVRKECVAPLIGPRRVGAEAAANLLQRIAEKAA